MPTGPTPTATRRPTLAVAYDQPQGRARAEALSAELALPLAKGFRDPHEMHVVVDGRGWVCLRVNPDAFSNSAGASGFHALAGGHDVCVDLLSIDTRSGAGRAINTPFFKALGVRKGHSHRPRVLDATAGLGEDAWLMASAGCEVVCLERDPLVQALLRDGLDRAMSADATAQRQEARPTETHQAPRITLRPGSLLDAGCDLAIGNDRPFEVVYLDPMFPTGRRAVERKPMRMLRALVGEDDDAQALWQAAMRTAARRVVVKRPRKGPPLGDHPPAHTHAGKALRYDVYLPGSPR